VARTGRTYAVYFSERLHVESAMYATELVARRRHRPRDPGRRSRTARLGKAGRPAGVSEKAKFGGILCDIGSHQFEQFLTYSGATDATCHAGGRRQFRQRRHTGFEDFGEASLLGNNGSSNYIRVDWFTPAGLSTWGDGRTGHPRHEGLHRAAQVRRRRPRTAGRQRLPSSTTMGEQYINVTGKVGFPFLGQLISTACHRTRRR